MGYVTNPAVEFPTLSSLGVLSEGLGQFKSALRQSSRLRRKARDPRRTLAMLPVVSRGPGGTVWSKKPTVSRVRPIIKTVKRIEEGSRRAVILPVERPAFVPLPRPRPVLSQKALACGPVPDRRMGWNCIGGQWRYSGMSTTMPVRPRVEPRPIRQVERADAVPRKAPDMAAAPVRRDVLPFRAARDTSGIPVPPGLPGGPSMRPPRSRADMVTERVEAAPAPAMDLAKLLPLAAAGLLLMAGGS